jgi:hypothetical protein
MKLNVCVKFIDIYFGHLLGREGIDVTVLLFNQDKSLTEHISVSA